MQCPLRDGYLPMLTNCQYGFAPILITQLSHWAISHQITACCLAVDIKSPPAKAVPCTVWRPTFTNHHSIPGFLSF
ncbi:Phosphatidylinositol transfer protein sfh5 [Fusarium oxysporum f. sp. albedinis]|nr:Phosphatidylinositol transfer protein sfh5 [Fusarium oxysporum f. sp. albedinis]